MRLTLLLTFLLTTFMWTSSCADAQERRLKDLVPLRGVRRLLVLGDSITYSRVVTSTRSMPMCTSICLDNHIEIINIGLPSENLSGLTEPNHAGGAFPRPDLHERLARALAKIKPDMVVACYGMNDGMYYPFSLKDRFPEV